MVRGLMAERGGSGYAGEAGVYVVVEAPPEADVIFLPIDSAGTPGKLNRMVRESLQLDMPLPSREELSSGFALQHTSRGLLCYVVTIANVPTREALARNLQAALDHIDVTVASTYWIPLMGTGDGRLDMDASFEIILDALEEHEAVRNGRVRVVISLPPDTPPPSQKIFSSQALHFTKRYIEEPSSPWSTEINWYGVDCSPTVIELLRVASTYAVMPEPRRQNVTTSLLFFALGESHSPVTEQPLYGDSAAEYFVLTLEELFFPEYQDAWLQYFGDQGRPTAFTKPLLPPSDNVAAIFAEAQKLAGGEEQVVEIDNVIQALLSSRDTRLQKLLNDNGLDADELLLEYRDSRLGRVASRFQNDVAGSEDHLDYARYAKAIHAFLTDAATKAPLSISIQAPWGGGKSTLMHLVREALDPAEVRNRFSSLSATAIANSSKLLLGTVKDLLNARNGIDVAVDEGVDPPKRRWTIWFNAWKYETTEQLWAGLVDAIVSQVSQRLSPLEREKFLLKLQLARIDDDVIRKRIYDRIANLWWRKAKSWVIAAGTAAVGLFGFTAAGSALDSGLRSAIAIGTGSGVVLLALGFLVNFFCSKSETEKEPANFSLADFIKVPDYDRGVGELHHVHADLKKVLELVPHKCGEGLSQPLVIFIDDLDRCSPGKVASVVEGVSMLLATDEYRCMFVIGMDPQMVAAALEKAHEDVRQKLPSYERAVPLGWRFMDKFVQLPFTVPRSEQGDLETYVDWLAGGARRSARTSATIAPDNTPEELRDGTAAVAGQPVQQQSEPDPVIETSKTQTDPVPETQAEAVEAFRESRNVGTIIRKIAGSAIDNPREMKRMVNLARFYLTLRAARCEKEPEWRAPSPDQYARWIILTLRWPDMMRWLQWGADEAHWPNEPDDRPLVVRRLRALEEYAATSASAEKWQEALTARLGLPEQEKGTWLRDVKLFEFFQGEAEFDEGRLSSAAERGFW